MASKNPIEILKSIYIAFLDSSYLRKFEESGPILLGFNPFRNIVWLTFALIEPLGDKHSALLELTSDSRFLAVTADIVKRLMLQAGDIPTNDPKLREKKWLSDEDYKKIADAWSGVAIDELENANFINSIYASHVYYVLYRAAPNKVKQLFSNWLNEDSGIEKIAKLIGYCGSDSTNGPFTQITEEDLSDFLDYSQLKELAEAELSSGKEITPFFRAVYLSITTGNKYYLRDASEEEKF